MTTESLYRIVIKVCHGTGFIIDLLGRPAVDIIMNVLLVVIVITSSITVLLVLLNRGQGGGLSDMFGGGMTSSLNSSGMASKNLIRLTITVTVIWVIAVVLYGLALRFNGQFVI